jgi:hypothetical protein
MLIASIESVDLLPAVANHSTVPHQLADAEPVAGLNESLSEGLLPLEIQARDPGVAISRAQPSGGNVAEQSSTAPGDTSPVEYELFQYLWEVEQAGFTRRGADPSVVATEVFETLGGMVEHFQQGIKAEPGVNPPAVDELAVGFDTEEASPDSVARTAEAGKASSNAQLLSELAAFSSAAFGASMAIAGVSAATNAVNTLVKQQ